MRVCMLTTSYPRWSGDLAGTFVADLAAHLATEQGMAVTVLAPGAAGLPARERQGGVTVRRLAYFWPPHWQRLAYGDGIPWNLRQSPLAWLNLPSFFLAFAAALSAEGRGADVIHAHWGLLGALAAAGQHIHRRPVVLTVHGSDLKSTLPPIRQATRWAIRHCAAVITLSREFFEACRSYRSDPSTCYRLANGVNAPSSADLRQRRAERLAPNVLRIVTVGRLVPERRHDLLIAVLARVRREFPAAVLTIVGDGPQQATLGALAARLGVADAVRFAGRVSRADVPHFLLDADLYVSPTAVETFGLAVAEAALHALPIVTTRVGFPGELVVDGRTGYVVSPGDAEALAAAISKALADPGREAMGWRMRERAEAMGLTWRECAARTAEVYRRVLTQGSRT